MKKIVLIAIAATMLLVCGCKSENTIHVIKSDTQTEVTGSGFNEEHYIWEGFIFTTNRVEKVK